MKIRAPSILWETRRGPRRFFQRERARYTIAAELLADRARVKRAEQLLRLWPQSASRLLHRHWVKGEQNREIIDFHFLRSLSLPLSPSLSFFLTLFRSLSFAFHPALSLSLSLRKIERDFSRSRSISYTLPLAGVARRLTSSFHDSPLRPERFDLLHPFAQEHFSRVYLLSRLSQSRYSSAVSRRRFVKPS